MFYRLFIPKEVIKEIKKIMIEAKYYKKLKGNSVQCQLCPHFCIIENNKKGFCGVRENKDGQLFSLVYGKPVAVNVDPVEKKPLFHFLPGTKTFSLGTTGCNLHCMFCQNWDISQCKNEDVPYISMSPEQVVNAAIQSGCESISYTYNEPTIFIEYVLDCARLAKKQGLKNVIVSNGFINPEPLKDLLKVIDAANIDVKAFNEKFYKEMAGARLKPVLEALKQMKGKNSNDGKDGKSNNGGKGKTCIELTNLIIPGKNDDLKEIEKMCKWIAKELGKEMPLHFSRFFPMYRMLDNEPTPDKTLQKAKAIAEKYLDYVYVGNVSGESNTYCKGCKSLLIQRQGYDVQVDAINRFGKCEKCGEFLPGVF
jgi:pyruvate formate lyase activating enzyme